MHWEHEELLYRAAKHGKTDLALKHLAKIPPETKMRWVLGETISLCISRINDAYLECYPNSNYLLLAETLIDQGYVIHDNHFCNMTKENLDFYTGLLRKHKLAAI